MNPAVLIYLRRVVRERCGAPAFNEVLLEVDPLRARVEHPRELEVAGGVGDDVAGHADALPLGHAVDLDLVRFAEWLV